MTDAEPNPLELDAAYRPFPTFDAWNSKTTLDIGRWNRYKLLLDKSHDKAPEILRRAREIAKRAAAFDTGAIEGLYDSDRGFTYTVAFETTAWEIALGQKGEEVRSLFEAQLHAYDYVLDLATNAQPISEAAVRALHEVVCKAQDTYRVMTAVGPQEQPLPKGQYKSLPNHVRTRTGENHSYAPVDVTPVEMARLVGELRTEAFLAAHSVRQAAYAHYCFVVIHPFADGNGRVARALASAFTYKAVSTPIVILSEHKTEYLNALEAADRGDYEKFEHFMLSRSLDTLQLVDESIRSADAPSPEAALKNIERLYLTKGGYTQDEIDGAGQKILSLIHKAFDGLIAKNKLPKLSVNFAANTNQLPGTSTHRPPMTGQTSIIVIFTTSAPAQAQTNLAYFLMLPKDAGSDDDIMFTTADRTEHFSARVDELIPTVSGILQMRVNMFAERAFGEALEQLAKVARGKLGS